MLKPVIKKFKPQADWSKLDKNQIIENISCGSKKLDSKAWIMTFPIAMGLPKIGVISMLEILRVKLLWACYALQSVLSTFCKK